MLKKSYPITRCQVSNFKNLETILNLGYLPPVNDFKKIGTTQKESKFYPTELLYCNKSKLFQLGFVVSKDILFPKSYPYTSSTTKILRDNFLDLSTKCKKRFNLKKNDLIVDIGSNDGNLLSHFKDFSKVLGVTPEEIGKIAEYPYIYGGDGLFLENLVIANGGYADIIQDVLCKYNTNAHQNSLSEINETSIETKSTSSPIVAVIDVRSIHIYNIIYYASFVL